MNVAQKWEEKATQWDGPIKIILLSPPKIPALPLPYETTKRFEIQIKIYDNCNVVKHVIITKKDRDKNKEWDCKKVSTNQPK